MKALESLRNFVGKLLDSMVVAFFIVIFCVVLAQIYYRYIRESPLVWSEELSRYIFIWVSLLGWVLATRSGTHIRITFFQERLPAPVRKFLDFIFQLCTLGFLGVLFWLGWEMSSRAWGRGAVTIPQIKMGMVYAAMPAGAALGIFYTLCDMALGIGGKAIDSAREDAA